MAACFSGTCLLLCALFLQSFGYLMILPIVGVLLAYAAGIALIESSRGRTQVVAHRLTMRARC